MASRLLKNNPFSGRTLYRYFDSAEHAAALTKGEVWISTFARCRQYENAHQGDPEEGFLYYNTGTISARDTSDPNHPALMEIARRGGLPVGPNWTDVIIENCQVIRPGADAFILCTSKRFDPTAFSEWWDADFCCEITDGGEFFRLVTERLGGLFGARLTFAMGEVVYRGRGYTGLENPPGPVGFLKPPRYQGQDEVRMVWEVFGPGPYKAFPLHCPEVAPLCRQMVYQLPSSTEDRPELHGPKREASAP